MLCLLQGQGLRFLSCWGLCPAGWLLEDVHRHGHALSFTQAVAALAFHLPEAGAAASYVRPILLSSPPPLSQFRKQEGLRERQVCKELLQLPSAQAPELLVCKEIDKQYIWSLLVKAFLSLALQPLSKGGIHIHILSVMPA